MATRRQVLLGASAAALATAVPARAAATPALISAARIAGNDSGALWRESGLETFALPGRGHALAHLPRSGKIILCARRPGTFAALLDPADIKAPPVVLAPASGNRFAGHAAVSPDGERLVTSEFAAGTFDGALAVRDSMTGAVETSWNPRGIEPHEILFLADGSRLIAALGGLIKDGGVAGPAFNPGGIDSALVEIDPATGAVALRHALPDAFRSLSLRHIALAGDSVVVGMQDQDLSETRPLLAILEPGDRLDLLPWPTQAQCDFRGYVGSVSASPAYALAASPRGGVLGAWSVTQRRWLGGLHISDVCGLARGTSENEFWASSGLGDILQIGVDETGPRILARWRADAGFDNHLLRV